MASYDDDGYDSEPTEEEFYDDGSDSVGDDEESNATIDSDEENTATCSRPLNEHYNLLSVADIRHRQEEDITMLSNVLSVSRSSACILLCHYNWNTSKLDDEWFTNEENVRKTVGLLEKHVFTSESKLNCPICFETLPRETMSHAACGHYFCKECWSAYIHTKINNGCLKLRCPSVDPPCAAAVGDDMINNLASNKDKEKYSYYLLRSYIENNKKTKWCPSPGCEFAVEILGSGICDVSCACSSSFCWNCTTDVHRPVNCDTAVKWITKASAESENVNWLLANSKPCPECKRPIEKNEGCMHMTCRSPCRHQFCWLCLRPWDEHCSKTGGYYACNRFEEAKKNGNYDESEQRRRLAKIALSRYTHYYERWAANEKSRNKALEDLNTLRTEKMSEFCGMLGKLEHEFDFLINAWLQIAECRRVLKWTYAYGYYVPEHEHLKKQLFEYLQGEAESGLERLHYCAEMEILQENTMQHFVDFRTKLVTLTSVTKNYFGNLIRALENELKDVVVTPKQTAKARR